MDNKLPEEIKELLKQIDLAKRGLISNEEVAGKTVNGGGDENC